MRGLCFSLVAGFCAAFAGCGDDTECLLDSDCADLFQICLEDECVPRGTSLDGGPLDEGGVRDAGDSGGRDAQVDAGPTVVRSGQVTATQTPTGDAATTPRVVSASFSETVVDGADGPCTVETMDGCTINDCFFPAPPMDDAGMPDAGPPPDAGMPVFPHAGLISVDGDTNDVLLTAGADGIYPTASGMGQVWSADTAVAVNATGDTVPAFSASLTGPSQSMITSPSFMTPPVTVSRAAELTLMWSGGGGTVETRISNSETMAEGTWNVSIECDFDADAGTGTIAAAVLGRVPAGDSASLSVSNVAEQRPDVEGWDVSVRLAVPATLDTGAIATTIITLSD